MRRLSAFVADQESIYGGYFNGGLGILLMALYTLTGMVELLPKLILIIRSLQDLQTASLTT